MEARKGKRYTLDLNVMQAVGESQIAPRVLEMCAEACRSRDRKKGRVVTFSPKVFIPLTRLCRDECGYCTFRKGPGKDEAPYLSAAEVLSIARAGERAGCREALFVLGERPEQRYPEARDWLSRNGYAGTVDYLAQMCRLVLDKTSLYPHSNPGTLSARELEALKKVNVSMGLMLESTSLRLCRPGGPHEKAPSKRPKVRLRTLELAGQLQIPMTTGILIGLGESRRERVDALEAIGRLQERFGHIQEVIIQNFRPKPSTPMADSSGVDLEEMLETIATARLILGGSANIQAPPNLAAFHSDSHLLYLEAGINDWGGISPVTPDHVNPEAPWPHIGRLREDLQTRGYRLKARFPVYPRYFLSEDRFVPALLRERLEKDADSSGLVPDLPSRPGEEA